MLLHGSLIPVLPWALRYWNSPAIIDLILVPISDPTVYCHYFDMDHIYTIMVGLSCSSWSVKLIHDNDFSFFYKMFQHNPIT
jgi:hypothetical protein